MSRTLRRQHFNRKTHSGYNHGFTSFAGVDDYFKYCDDNGYSPSFQKHHVFSDSFDKSMKDIIQLYKRRSVKRMRQEFSVKKRKLIQGYYEDNELILDLVSPECIKYFID